ncbi:MAG TPA: hypothetical protein VF395_10925 [Polyangiaceae bacterium]
MLGILAAVSVMEGLAVLACVFGAFLIYRRVMTVVSGIEQRQVAPAAARVNAILDDVRGVTSTVKEDAERVDGVVRWVFQALQRCRVVLILLAGSLLFSSVLVSRAFASDGPTGLDKGAFGASTLKSAVPLDVERRGPVIETTSATIPRALHLGDVTVLRLEDRTVKVRFTMVGVPPLAFPSPYPTSQALVTVRLTALVLPASR